MVNPPEEFPDSVMRTRMDRLMLELKKQRPAAQSTRAASSCSSSAVSAPMDLLADQPWYAARELAAYPEGVETIGFPEEGKPIGRGTTVDRFVVLKEIGSGGMGAVYAAYDPQLDRRIALKLVLPDRSRDEDQRRLHQEARALARLSHPNIVGVYESGTMDTRVWLAMELVEGQTLRDWMRERRRDWRVVLRVMRQAGTGLAAAHAAGLLHRDFKPGNVMIANDERVHVMDFGLACVDPNSGIPRSDTTASDRVVPAIHQTRPSEVRGTPGYIAPEQLMGETLTPAADQFSFCVTLWEGLFGERPFRGESVGQLARNILGGRIGEPSRPRDVPKWLHHVCKRGLSRDPGQRFASMESLLEALNGGHRRAWMRRVLMFAVLLMTLVAGIFAFALHDRAQRVAACQRSGDEIEATWNPDVEAALQEGILATGVSYAPKTAENVMPWLRRQSEAWRDARVDVCLDTEVRGIWEEATLNRALWCLEERRMQLSLLVDDLTHADDQTVRKAVSAAARLSPIGECTNTSDLVLLGTPPDGLRDEVRELRASLVRSHNLQIVTRYSEALALNQDVLTRAESIGWSPLTSEARYSVGASLLKVGQYAESEKFLEESYFESINGVNRKVAFLASKALVYLVGHRLGRHDEGLRWGRHAAAHLLEVTSDGDLRGSSLKNNLAIVYGDKGEYEKSKQLHQEVLDERENCLGTTHPLVATSLSNLASIHQYTADYTQASELFERVARVREIALGPEHPVYADSLANLGVHHLFSGEYLSAADELERALEIKERAFGADSMNNTDALSNLGSVYTALGRHDEAIALKKQALVILEDGLGEDNLRVAGALEGLGNAYLSAGEGERAMGLYERAIALAEESRGQEHPTIGNMLSNLSSVYSDRDDLDTAIKLQTRALEIFRKSLGDDHPNVASASNNLANYYRESREYERARKTYLEALSIWKRFLREDHPKISYPLYGLAATALAQGQVGAALEPARKALELREQGHVEPKLIAFSQFLLAQIYWELPEGHGRDRPKGLALAMTAVSTMRARNVDDETLVEAENWLRGHLDASRPE